MSTPRSWNSWRRSTTWAVEPTTAVPAELALITDERLDRYLAQARATARALEVLLLAPAERRGFGEGP
ncbi:hypothetical protein ACFUT3_27495 [Streptomyces cinereoruber]|uniref:hypothetical protein n=1 Tax=Streptomyces cinereoruber TaxID=67260 RepID=UPI003628F0EF